MRKQLSPSVQQDLLGYTNDHEFEDTYDTKETGTLVKGIWFFETKDRIVSPLLGVGEPDQTWHHPIWELVKVPMLVMTEILWDSVLSTELEGSTSTKQTNLQIEEAKNNAHLP